MVEATDDVPQHDSDLPADFCEARAQDEPFWRVQEGRIQGATTQPCCTLSGMTTGLAQMSGDFAVVIHGEQECASSFVHAGPGMSKIFCTGLTDWHFASGQTDALLRRCLRVVAAELRPRVIFVLGSCPVQIIEDRFEAVVAEVADELPEVALVPLRTSGLALGSQDEMLDSLFATLATLAPSGERPAGRQATVHFIGLPRERPGRSEPADVLGGLGLILGTRFPERASLADWLTVGEAAAALVADRTLYPKLTAALTECGQTVLTVPLPVGVAQTTELYHAVGEQFDMQAPMEAAIAPRRAAAEQALAAFRQEVGPLRLALGLRMLNNYRADQLAYLGLGDQRAFEEMGCDITLMVQGPPEKAAELSDLFVQRGVRHPFEMFPEPWTIAEPLRRGRFDLACLADHCLGEARKAGVPMIVSRSLVPWFAGVERNLNIIRQVLQRRV